MRRRKFITLLGGFASSLPIAARGQQTVHMRHIGVLMSNVEGDPFGQTLVAAFQAAVSKLGWSEGNDLRIELRWGAADADKIRTFAKELVDLRVDAILAHTTPVTEAVARETRMIPIVFAVASDPVGSGFAASVAHPGGNITGFTNLDAAMGGKWVELLKQIAPRTTHMALLFKPAVAGPLHIFMPSIQAAASSLAVRISTAPVDAKDEIEGVIAEQARNPGGGLIMLPDIFSVANRDLIIALTARYGVPAIYFNRYFAESGGLIAYSDDFAEEFRLAAGYIDRILKGAKPGDLPVQAPTKFQLTINLKTAKALSLVVPQSLLATADEVFE
jgi:putative tryptophan/tyrosine transport system substrate-binding protein